MQQKNLVVQQMEPSIIEQSNLKITDDAKQKKDIKSDLRADVITQGKLKVDVLVR